MIECTSGQKLETKKRIVWAPSCQFDVLGSSGPLFVRWLFHNNTEYKMPVIWRVAAIMAQGAA